MPSCARIAAIDRSILPRPEASKSKTGNRSRWWQDTSPHRPAISEKTPAAPEHGAAGDAIVIEQNGNAAYQAAECARGAYRFLLLVVLQLPLAVDDLNDHTCTFIETVVVGRRGV